MKVLVTGRHGQLARSLARRATLHPDLEIRTTGRDELDLAEPAGAAELLRRLRPDALVNAAAYTSVDDAEDAPARAMRINGEGAGALAEAARDVGARFIQISTDYVFDGTAPGPRRPDDPTHPLGAYGRSKLEGEARVRRSGAPHAIVRTAWVYSPWGRNFVRTMMTLARSREEVAVVADQVGNPSSALDLADGLLGLLDRWAAGDDVGLGRTYHLAGAGDASWADFAEAIFAACADLGHASARVRRIATADFPTRAARPRDSRLDGGDFARDIGFAMPCWRDSLPPIVAAIAAGDE
jgi:dTDP-4-dehydrorhamnose reductase